MLIITVPHLILFLGHIMNVDLIKRVQNVCKLLNITTEQNIFKITLTMVHGPLCTICQLFIK